MLLLPYSLLLDVFVLIAVVDDVVVAFVVAVAVVGGDVADVAGVVDVVAENAIDAVVDVVVCSNSSCDNYF